MMKTSRIALWILCLALVASCKKNGNTGNDVPENGFRATIEQTKGGGSKGERTHINPDWGNEEETGIYWSAGDHIKVSNQSGNTLTFQLTEGENTMYGTFYTGEQNDGFFEPDYMAAYPEANAEGTATTISGSTATFSMLSTQSYKANTFDEGAMPMVASSSTQTLDFRNVFGGLCIPLCGDGLTVTSVKLTSLNTTEKLWGVFTADCTSSNPVPAHVSGGDNTLTLECSGGVALNATTPTDFYFMVPPGTLESGFTVTAYNGTAMIYNETANWTATPVTGFIPRSVVMKVNTSLQIVVEPLEVRTVNPTSITKNSAFGLGQVTSGTPTTRGLLFIRYDKITDPSNPAADLVLNSANTNVLVTTDVVQGTVCYGNLYEGLDEDTKYYVCAFATNSAGIPYYGAPVLFTTLMDYFEGPYPGVLVDPSGNPYEYSVSPTRKVWFSAGNLQFNAAMGSHNRADGTTAPGTWRFAEHQWDFVGDAEKGTVYENGVKCDNALISSSYGGWIDLFGWATSGYRDLNDPHVRRYYPYSWENDRIENDVNEYGYGPSSVKHGFQNYTNYDLIGEYANYDWGVYNAISNGGNAPGQWRALLNQYSQPNNYGTSEITEWAYLIQPVTPNRPNYRVWRAKLYVNGNVNQSVTKINYDGYDHWFCGNTVNGLVIFPDSFTLPEEGIRTLSYINNITSNLSYRPLSEAEWSVLERAGCVFLPATGRREVKEVIFGEDTNSSKYDRTFYSSTAVHNSASVRLMRFGQRKIEPWIGGYMRCTGFPVRLVRDAN